MACKPRLTAISLSYSREVKIFLHCDRSLADGEEQITTIGDSQIKLIYVS